jgi:Holliday junction resolvase RusA-like endonuclease
MENNKKRKAQEPQWFVFNDIKSWSANNFYGFSKVGKKFITGEAAKWQKALVEKITDEMKKKKVSGDVQVELFFGFKDKRHRDVDNGIKHTLDILKNRIIDDDVNVGFITGEKVTDCPNDFIYVRVSPMEILKYEELLEGIKTVYPEEWDSFYQQLH